VKEIFWYVWMLTRTEAHGEDGGALEKSKRRAIDLAFSSVGDGNFLLRPLLVAFTSGPEELISTFASISSRGLLTTVEHFGNFDG
jgi:hypothetical protein